MKPTKNHAILNFVSSVPEMTSKAVTRDNILHGGLENGIIDRKLQKYPDFDAILTTCKLDPTKEEYQLCVNSFPYLFKLYQVNGYVEDDVFGQLEFPMDIYVDGLLVCCYILVFYIIIL